MAIYLIVLLCLLNHACFSGSRMVMSLYALDLGASQFTIGVLMALYAICPLFFAIYAGRLADRLGPRGPMLAGTAGVGIAMVLPPLFPGLTTLYISSLLIGSSFHFFFVSVHGTTGGVGGPENRARNYSLVSLGFSGAGFIGPFISGFAIDHLGHLNAFLCLAAFTVVPFMVMWLKPGFLPKAAKPAHDAAQHRVLDLWRMPKLRGAFIASGILSAAWDLFQFYFPIYGHSIGLSASVIGAVLAVFALATFIVRIGLPALARRTSEAEVLVYGIFIAAVAFVLFPFFANAWLLAMVAFILGIGVGAGQPMSMSLIYALAPPGRSSEAAGLRVMVNNVAHLFIPLFFGSVGAAFGFVPVFVSNAAMLVAGGVVLRRKNAANADT
jgi:predicted MFS family arabinose efflux permease